jgi:hypothetical protein
LHKANEQDKGTAAAVPFPKAIHFYKALKTVDAPHARQESESETTGRPQDEQVFAAGTL